MPGPENDIDLDELLTRAEREITEIYTEAQQKAIGIIRKYLTRGLYTISSDFDPEKLNQFLTDHVQTWQEMRRLKRKKIDLVVGQYKDGDKFTTRDIEEITGIDASKIGSYLGHNSERLGLKRNPALGIWEKSAGIKPVNRRKMREINNKEGLLEEFKRVIGKYPNEFRPKDIAKELGLYPLGAASFLREHSDELGVEHPKYPSKSWTTGQKGK